MGTIETSKSQLSGGSADSIAIPKQWADWVGIGTGALVSHGRQADVTRVIHPTHGSPTPKRKTIAVSDITGDALTRDTIAAYLAGMT